MITIGVKEVFRQLDGNESELVMLGKQNELLRGYLHEIVGTLDQDNLETTLSMALEKKDKVNAQVDSFLGACQQWHDNFEQKGVQTWAKDPKVLTTYKGSEILHSHGFIYEFFFG